jgi:class 3 adenylate cyclase
MGTSSSIHLYRRHLLLILAGGFLSLAGIIPVALVVLRLEFFTTVVILLGAFIATFAINAVSVHWLYQPLGALERLPLASRYVQNNDLSRCVVRLHNLPLIGVARVLLMQAPVFTGVAMLGCMLAGGDLAHGLPLWIGSISFLHVLAALIEYHGLQVLIETAYADVLSYRYPLASAWKSRVISIGGVARFGVIVLMFGIAPMVALLVSGEETRSVIVLVTIVIATLAGLIKYRFRSRPLQQLLDAMHEVQQGTRRVSVNITAGNEYLDLAEGIQRMVAGLEERQLIRSTFGKHVPRAVMEALLREGLKLDGERRSVALLGVTIRNFEHLTTALPPGEALRTLNRYLAMVVASARHFGGTIDRIAENNVIVVYGAPLTLDLPVSRALYTALDIREQLAKTEGSTAHFSGNAVGMAVHFGRVLCGRVGAGEHMEYSFVGEALAATERLAGLTTESDTDILVSTAACLGAGSEFAFANPITCPPPIDSARPLQGLNSSG